MATTIGAALGTVVVAFLLDASWPLRIGLVAVALLLVGGYLFLQGRRGPAQTEDAAAPTAPPEPPTPTTETPEDPTA